MAAAQRAYAELEEQRGECVVLLHGIWRSALAMKPWQWHLQEQGYSLVNESYSSLPYSIPELADMAAGGGLITFHAIKRTVCGLSFGRFEVDALVASS